MLANRELTDLTEVEFDALASVARRVRMRIVDMFSAYGRGHYGGSFSVVEALVTLYGKVLRIDPANPGWAERDRLILSKGHCNAALCAVLGHYGFLDWEKLTTYGQLDSPFGQHPDMHSTPGCDMTTGSLGHGLAVGAGMALCGRAEGQDYRVYVVLGDGECDEGTVWEAAMVASHHKLDNLTAIVDRNRLSLDGFTEQISSLEPFADKWRAFGWQALEVDGHDFRALHAGLKQAQQRKSQPTVLISNSVKGKGVSFMENSPAWHSGEMTKAQLEAARAELMGVAE